MIKFYCKDCGQKISAPEKHAGKKGKCPKCKNIIVVPKAEKTVSCKCAMCGYAMKASESSRGELLECPKCKCYVEIPAEQTAESENSSDSYSLKEEEYATGMPIKQTSNRGQVRQSAKIKPSGENEWLLAFAGLFKGEKRMVAGKVRNTRKLDMDNSVDQKTAMIVLVVVTLIGITTSYFLVVKPAGKIAEAQNWDKKLCTIESMDYKVKVERSSRPGNTTNVSSRMVVRYTYEYDGRKYWSSNYRYGKGKYSQGMIYQPGQQADCFVNPKNPAEAVMIRDDSALGWWALLPIGFVVLGIGGIANTVRHMVSSRNS